MYVCTSVYFHLMISHLACDMFWLQKGILKILVISNKIAPVCKWSSKNFHAPQTPIPLLYFLCISTTALFLRSFQRRQIRDLSSRVQFHNTERQTSSLLWVLLLLTGKRQKLWNLQYLTGNLSMTSHIWLWQFLSAGVDVGYRHCHRIMGAWLLQPFWFWVETVV